MEAAALVGQECSPFSGVVGVSAPFGCIAPYRARAAAAREAPFSLWRVIRPREGISTKRRPSVNLRHHKGRRSPRCTAFQNAHRVSQTHLISQSFRTTPNKNELCAAGALQPPRGNRSTDLRQLDTGGPSSGRFDAHALSHELPMSPDGKVYLRRELAGNHRNNLSRLSCLLRPWMLRQVLPNCTCSK